MPVLTIPIEAPWFALKTSLAREFDTSGVILEIFGPRVLKNQ